MKLLVIEDEPELRNVLVESLKKEAFVVESAGSVSAAMDKIAAFDYDCILLDIMLPDGSGIVILKHLKTLGKADNVIIISAKDSLDDKLTGLNLGADDYLTKPFHIAELNARIKSVLRRKTFHGSNVIEVANVKVDLDNHLTFINQEPVVLNRKEFDVLVYFLVNKDRLVNKTSLAERVWGDYIDQSDDFDFIYSQIKNLRKKLKDHGAALEIQAVYGLGYKLVTI